MKRIDRSMYVNQLPEKNQLMVMDAVLKHIKESGIENPAEAVSEAMNSRLYDLDEILPDYMQYTSADKYIKSCIYSCDDDTAIYAWNTMCFAEFDDNSVINYMRDFTEFFEHGEAFDIVASAIRGSFDPDLDYFKVFTDHRLNLDRICSYSSGELWGGLIDVDRLSKYMAENPEMAPGEIKKLHEDGMLEWFGLKD